MQTINIKKCCQTKDMEIKKYVKTVISFKVNFICKSFKFTDKREMLHVMFVVSFCVTIVKTFYHKILSF